ncbi:hypothetical protein AURDEDRAFT_116126 [Auricularia subglabra TFB-10046 SS5]|uniref:DRBM domain-containing protein n=1 Tax=Auricularia subglabra (strain TFB-10046 / SS5) TaxID=717982 RepID=J0DC66_AURST|nr:hypothetical protein AURDEDRAFT_116126 [Auricularia subglabra TFB-10046 SS5]
MDPRRHALPSSAYHRPAAHPLSPSALPQLTSGSYPMGSPYAIPSSASRAHAPVNFEPSPLDPARRVVQRPYAPAPSAHNYTASAAYPAHPTSAAAHRLHYAPSQGSLTPPSPARPLGAAPTLFPASPPPSTPTPKQTDILELHNEVMRQGRALDWKDEQVPGHMWRSTVLIDNREMGIGDGRTKKDARHKAARSALLALSQAHRAQPRARPYQ